MLSRRQAALQALGAYPGGLQLGGGVTTDNAVEYLDAGASHVIVTSLVFRDGRLDEERLAALVRSSGWGLNLEPFCCILQQCSSVYSKHKYDAVRHSFRRPKDWGSAERMLLSDLSFPRNSCKGHWLIIHDCRGL